MTEGAEEDVRCWRGAAKRLGMGCAKLGVKRSGSLAGETNEGEAVACRPRGETVAANARHDVMTAQLFTKTSRPSDPKRLLSLNVRSRTSQGTFTGQGTI
jgi:hypothetical protein